MKKDKIRVYIFELLLIFILVVFLFSTKLLINKILISIFLLVYALIVKKSIKSKKMIPFHSKEVTKYMVIFASLYLVLYYLIGFYVGYYRSTYQFNFWVIINYIVPIIAIIISSEVLRKEFLSVNNKLSLVLIFIIGILVDTIIYTNSFHLNSIHVFFNTVGYVFFASIASNLLYNYICSKFGIKSNIIYRIITIIYLYIIPITPDVHMYFKSFARIIYPIIILLVLQDSYEKKVKILEIKSKKIRSIVTVIFVTVLVLFTMLLSCNFRYGLMVIGSGSMEKTLYKGDAILYDSKVKKVEEGNIILFDKRDFTIVHRIIKIENINDELRIYTKGDNNKKQDDGYIIFSDVKGIVKFKIGKVGLPTIWVNEIFK